MNYINKWFKLLNEGAWLDQHIDLKTMKSDAHIEHYIIMTGS